MEENRSFDVVIPILKIDLPTFLKNIPYIQKHIPCKRIVVIGNIELYDAVKDNKDLVFIDEDKLYQGLSIQNIKNIKKQISGSSQRAGWYFQQFLKMAYSTICKDDYYLIWDADTIPVRKIEFFDSKGLPYLDYTDYKSYDECYTSTQLAVLPNNFLKKIEHKSFITEHLLVNVQIMKQLIEDLTYKSPMRKGNFYENIMYSIPVNLINLSGFSEFECYAAYVLKTHPSSYSLRKWKNLRNAKTYIGDNVSKENLKWISEVFDVVSIEDFDSQWFICKSIRGLYPSIKFSRMYEIINPIYQIYFKFRLKIRSLIKT